MLQFRVNEQILSDHILKAYQKEIELRVASKEANKDTKKEEDDRRIRGLETYNMEANPKYNELFAGIPFHIGRKDKLPNHERAA